MPGLRVSEGKYLEILENAPAIDLPIEVDIYDGADVATMLATLDGAMGKTFERPLNEAGAGSFAIHKADPKAATVVSGNIAKFKIGGIYRHAIWIEEPSRVETTTAEEAGEVIKIGGRGLLAYLERAKVYPPIWPPAAGVLRGTRASNNGAGASSLALTLPAGTIAGDVVLVGLTVIGSAPATPTGWKRIRNITNGSLRFCLYRRRVTAAGGSVTFHWSSSHAATAAAATLGNVSSDDTSYAVNDTTGSGTSVKCPGVSVPLVDGVLLTFAGVAANTSFTPPTGLTEEEDENAAGRTLELASSVSPALGETGDLFATAGSSAVWTGLSVWVPSIASNDAIFEGSTFGDVLVNLIEAAQSRGTIPDLSFDFTAEADSHGEPWPDTHDLSFHIGTSLLEVWRHLVTLGLEGGMTPSLRLQAFVDASRHFEDTVILRKGRHLTGEVTRDQHDAGLRTRYLVEGAGGRVVEIPDPLIEADPRVGRREGYLGLTTSDSPTTLQRAGEMALAIDADADEAREVDVDHGPASEGLYDPWVDYREGDWISLDEDGDGIAEPQRVVSITAKETAGGGYAASLTLNSVALETLLRLQRRMDALSNAGTSAGGYGGSGGGAGGGSSTAVGKVAILGSDTPGYLWDKVDAGGGISKTIVGDPGTQRLVLAFDLGDAVLPFGPVVTEQAFGQAPSDGDTAEAAHANHTHGTPPLQVGQLTGGFDGGNDVPEIDKTFDLVAPHNGTIVGWSLIGDLVGDASIDVAVAAIGAIPAFPADSITAGAAPAMSSASSVTSVAMPGWDLAIVAGTVYRFKLVSADLLHRVALTLHYTRTE